MRQGRFIAAGTAGLAAAAVAAATIAFAGADPSDATPTTTPIKHVVVIFGENISFDHYFGAYPNAQSNPGETPFTPAPGTPAVNGLTPALLTANPNKANPVRLNPLSIGDLVTCDFNHNYSPEQKAFNGGLMNAFVENTGSSCGTPSQVMGYYDGNTVTAMWNLAQHYALSDNSYGTNFGPSTVGAINLISGDTSGVIDDTVPGNAVATQAAVNNNAAYGNQNPYPDMDDCSGGGGYAFSGKNVGDLLNAKRVSWGWFQGGFKPTSTGAGGVVACGSSHTNVAGAAQGDYDAHHNPFAYYRSTTNRHHVAPSSVAAIGTNDRANHQYDLSDFEDAIKGGNLPSVSFLKAGHYQDGHAGYSSPIDEQHFVAKYVNLIAGSPEWKDTAIVLAYDDSDGWYDHQASQIVRTSSSTEDFLNGNGVCDGGSSGLPAANDRCGLGPRLPLLVVSPWARSNYVDHTQTDQTSILRFIEDNWSLGRIGGASADVQAGSLTGMFDFDATHARTAAIKLDESTGQVAGAGGGPASTTTAGSPTTDPPPTTPVPPPDGTKPTPTASVGKLACRGKRVGMKAKLSCTASTPATVRTALRFRLLKGKQQVATTSVTLKPKASKVAVTLKAKRALKQGSYTLSVSVAQAGTAAGALETKLKL